MENKAFSKIGILIILIILVAGGYFGWQYFGVSEEEEMSITVISLNGGEVLTEGQQFEIQWKTNNIQNCINTSQKR